MLELYVGLIPGEEPIDRLVDGVVADPAVSAIDTHLSEDLPEDLIVGDPGTGAILAIVAAGRRGTVDRHAVDLGDPSGLWRRLRTRWTRAHGPMGASHV
jgi:hypothetical protein